MAFLCFYPAPLFISFIQHFLITMAASDRSCRASRLLPALLCFPLKDVPIAYLIITIKSIFRTGISVMALSLISLWRGRGSERRNKAATIKTAILKDGERPILYIDRIFVAHFTTSFSLFSSFQSSWQQIEAMKDILLNSPTFFLSSRPLPICFHKHYNYY